MLYVIAFFAFALVLGIVFFVFRPRNKKTPEDLAYENYLKNFPENKNLKKLEPVFTKIAGVAYKNDDTGEERQKIIARTKVGERLMLVHDKLNKFDEDAIKVLRLNGEQIGFLNADLSVEISSRLKRGSLVEAKVLDVYTDNKQVLQVKIELQKYSRRGTY